MSLRDFIPPVIFKVRSALINAVKGNGLNAEEKAMLAKNSVFKNKHAGKRCFILGTGSSVGIMDLTVLANEITIGMNEFHLHPDFAKIRPSYMVFSGFGIHNVPMEKQLSWYPSYGQTIKGISTPFINIVDYPMIDSRGLLSENDVHYFHVGHSFTELPKKGIDLTKSIFASQSVGALSIQIALYMGFSEIYLVGFDHDWLLRMFDHKPTHFYKHDNSILYKNVNEVSGISVSYEAGSLVTLFGNYSSLKEHAHKGGTHIFNATVGGMLDVFPRVSFESLFQS